jgi:DNA-binding ferritin-like protein
MLDRLFGGFLAKAGKVDGKTAGKYLRDLAVCANAVDAWFHAAHLATTGTGFAGDHALLYGEIYESAGDAFDALMERAIGLSKDRTLADPAPLASDTAAKLRDWPSPVGPAEEIAGGSSDVVTYFLDEIKAKTEAMRDAGALSQGADNLLAQLADDFEGFGYKLGQRVQKGERSSHKYIRRVPKAGGGYSYIYGAGASVHPSAERLDHSNKHFASVTSHGGSGTTTLRELKGERGAAIRDALIKNPREPIHVGGYEATLMSRHGEDGIVSVRKKDPVAAASAQLESLKKRMDSLSTDDDDDDERESLGAKIAQAKARLEAEKRAAGAARATIQKGADVDALIAKVMAGGLDKSSAIAALKSRGVIKQDGEHLVMAKQKRKPSVGKYGTAANKRAVEIANGAPIGNRPVQEMLV